MADIDTERLRKIQRVAADRIHPDCHTARERLTEQVPPLLNELDRLQAENQRIAADAHSALSQAMEVEQQLRAENQRLEALVIHDAGGRAVTQGSFNAFMSDYNRVREQRDEMRSQRDSTIDALIVANAKCGHMTDEIESVLQLMDGLAEQWGDEGVFRRCRDRLRALTKEAGE